MDGLSRRSGLTSCLSIIDHGHAVVLALDRCSGLTIGVPTPLDNERAASKRYEWFIQVSVALCDKDGILDALCSSL